MKVILPTVTKSNPKPSNKPHPLLIKLTPIVFSMFIAAFVTAVFLVYDDTNDLYFTNIDNENDKDETQLNLFKNIAFMIFFLFGCIFVYKKFFKIWRRETVSKVNNVPNPMSEPKQEIPQDMISASKQSPKKLIFIYIILLPSIHAIIVIISGTIIDTFDLSAEDEFLILNNAVMLPAFAIWWIMAKKYLWILKPDWWIWTKLSAKEWFDIFSHEFVLEERRLLRNVIIGTLVTIFISFLIFSSISIPVENDSDSKFLGNVSLGIFLNLMFIMMFTIGKIYQQNKKKDFHLFVASGFCKRAIKTDDNVKTENMRKALRAYNDFFKRNHAAHVIEDVEKINVKINSEQLYTNSTIDEISRRLESGNNYSALEKIAKLMGVKNKEDLLKNNSIGIQIKYWVSTIIGPVTASIIIFILERIF